MLGKTDSRFCGNWGADCTAYNKLEPDHIAGSDCNLSKHLFLLCLFSRLVAELDKVWSFACKIEETEYQNKWLDIKREYIFLRGRDQRDPFPFLFKLRIGKGIFSESQRILYKLGNKLPPSCIE